jgi:hypothetical protein
MNVWYEDAMSMPSIWPIIRFVARWAGVRDESMIHWIQSFLTWNEYFGGASFARLPTYVCDLPIASWQRSLSLTTGVMTFTSFCMETLKRINKGARTLREVSFVERVTRLRNGLRSEDWRKVPARLSGQNYILSIATYCLYRSWLFGYYN